MDIIVTAVYGASLFDKTVSTKLVVVNDTTSAVARGWTLIGVQRLYPQVDGSAVITEGGGSVVYFANASGLVTPAGDFSKLVTGIPGGGNGWTRKYADSTKVVFDTLGRMIQVIDAFNSVTTVQYDGNSRVTKVRDPLNLPITLNYGTNGLSSVQDTMGRVTTVTVDASRRLTAIQDPDNVGATFGYDATLRLSSVTNRRGHTTTFAYDAQSGKLASITAPVVPLSDGTNGSPVSTFAAWQNAGVPYGSTATTPAASPLVDTVYGRITDPLGRVTRFTVNRWGSPAQTTDAGGGVTNIAYDPNGLSVRAAYPTGGVDTAAYNASGLPTWVQRAGLTATNFRYPAGSVQPDSIWGTGQVAVRNFIGSNGRVDSTRVGGLAVTRFAYTSDGRVSSIVDGEGHLLRLITYTGAYGSRSKDSLPGGRVTTYLQDAVGRDTAVKAPQQALRRTHYDVLNRTTEEFDGVNAPPTVYAYDSLFLRSVTDPKGQVFAFAYNPLGWVTQRIDPASHAQAYAYDRVGNLKRWTNRRGDTVTYAYDALDRVTSKGGSNTTNASWSYSADRRLVTSASPVDTETVYLNVAGRSDSVRTKLAGQTYWRRYRYTVAGLPDSLDISGGGIATFRSRKYIYNTSFGLLTAIRIAGVSTNLAQNKDGQDTSITFPGGDKTKKLLYALHGLTQRTTAAAYNSTIARSVSFDSAGRIKEQIVGNGSTGHRYTYDGLSRLTTDSTIQNGSPPSSCGGSPFPLLHFFGNSCFDGGTWSATGGVQFAYDSAGNRKDQGGSYAPGNRIRQFGSCTYVTDSLGDGNVLSRTCGSQTATMTWTAESRLATISVAGQTVAFHYDAAGRLVRRDLNGSPQSYLLWDGSNLLAELASTGTAEVAEYSYYPGLDNPHATVVGGTQYNAHSDATGSVTALTDGASAVKRTYTYDAWGAQTGGSDTRPFSNADRVRWKGALWLGPELDVYYMRARWYETASGRFLSEDPTGLAGGMNPYAYAGNDPINREDPTGLEWRYIPALGIWMDCYDFGTATNCYAIAVNGITVEAGGGGGPGGVAGGGPGGPGGPGGLGGPGGPVGGGGGAGGPGAGAPGSPSQGEGQCSVRVALRNGVRSIPRGAHRGFYTGMAVGMAVGAGGGGFVGTVGGVVLGAPTGPGAIVTGTAGGFIGALEGSFFGGLIGSYVGIIAGGAEAFLQETVGSLIDNCL